MQRGSNENTNGYYASICPKGSDLNAFSQTDLNAIAAKLNTRPRKKLKLQNPRRSLLHLSSCQNLESNVALQP